MDVFHVYPAIDLRHGKVVRLRQGDDDRQTIYGDDPNQVAQDWIQAGANWLHVINLDGAFGDDTPVNIIGLQSILDTGAKVQFGGGLRTSAAISTVLDMGVERVILGTAAIENPELLDHAIETYGGARIIVGIDARDGIVRVRGWTRGSQESPLALAKQIKMRGITTTIVTDISRDGMDQGVNLDLASQIANGSGLSVIAAGGVNSLEDVRRAKAAGLQGIIIGRALYEGQVSLEEALKC